jgi:cell volume regulation protein A
MIRELGGEVMAYRVKPGDAAAGRMVKELDLPREALVNVIVREGAAIPPRGSTVVEENDELHLLVRNEQRHEVEEAVARWETGPLGQPALPSPTIRGAPHVFSVRPVRETDDDPSNPGVVDATEVMRRLRVRRDAPGALAALADGRFAVTGPDLVAAGGRRLLARWGASRAERDGITPQERAWWQEVVGVLNAPEIR